MLRRTLWPLLCSLAVAVPAAAAGAFPADTIHVLEITEGWEYAPAADPSSLDAAETWQAIALPRALGTEPCGLFRVPFAVPAAWAGRRVTLVVRPLGGAVRAELNGQALGVRVAGPLDARLDVTQAARPGTRNTLVVVIAAPAELERGGLAACWLEATSPVGIERLTVVPSCLAQGALADVALDVANRTRDRFEGKVELALEPDSDEPGGHPVWRRGSDVRIEPGASVAVAHSFEVDPPRFWRFDAPALYRLTATVRTRDGQLVHTTVRRIGLRSVAVAYGRWLAAGEWVRLAGVAFRARGATLLCTQPGQADSLGERLAADPAPPLVDVLAFCDQRGIVALLDAPGGTPQTPGWDETVAELAAEADLHPCVWGWVAGGRPEDYAAVLPRLRRAAPRLPVGCAMPDVPADAAGFDFVVSRFAARAVREDEDGYGRRFDDLARDAATRAVVAIDALTPANPGDLEGMDRSIRRLSDEANRRSAVALLGVELGRDPALYRIAEQRLCPFSLKPPTHEVRLDKETFVLKSRFEVTLESPVSGRVPCYSLAGYRLVWQAAQGEKQAAAGTALLPTVQTRTIEGNPAGPGRCEAEWRVERAPGAGDGSRDVDFTAELQNAAGCVVARHRARLSLKAADGKAQLSVGPPPKAEAVPPAPRESFIAPERVVMLGLSQLFNNDAISSDPAKQDGNFDAPEAEAGSAYPADQLPAGDADLALASPKGLAFRFPDKAEGKPNNVRCDGQRMVLPPGIYSALWLLAAADTADQEGVATLVYAKGEEPVTLRVSEWCGEAKFGETEAVRCTKRHTADGKAEDKAVRIWAIPVPLRPEPLKEFALPKNGRIHLFAATLVRAVETTCVQVDALAGQFNNDGISWKAKPADGNFNLMGRGSGDTFIADLLPKAGDLVPVPGNEGVTFLFPSKDDRRSNNLVCDGQRIAFAEPYPSFDSVWFLGACHDGARVALLSIEYADGKGQGELRLADWCAKPAAGETDVLRFTARHTAKGTEQPCDCGLVAWRVALDPSRKLVAVTLPHERNMHVFAVSFSRTQIVEARKP